MESDDTIDYGSIMNVFTPGTLKTVCGASPALLGTRQQNYKQQSYISAQTNSGKQEL